MPLLPKTVRGTWLLALAAWAGCCAAVWWALPPAPRAQWRLPEAATLLDFFPDNAALLTAARQSPRGQLFCPPSDWSHGPVRVWDIPSGLLRREFLSEREYFHIGRVSRAGRWLAVARRGRGDDARVRLLDLSDGRIVAALTDSTWGVDQCRFGPADRWLDIVTNDTGDAIRLALPQLTPAGPPDPAVWAFATSPDGGVRAAADGRADDLGRVVVRDAVTLSPLGDVRLPAGRRAWDLSVSTGGAVVASRAAGSGPVGHAWCWRVADGQLLVDVPDTLKTALSGNGRTLAAIVSLPDPLGDRYALSIWDVTRGRQVAAHRPAELVPARPQVSPCGRLVAAALRAPPTDRLGELARRLGLPWFAPGPERNWTMLIDARTGRLRGRIPGDPDDAVWSPDGSLLATLDDDEVTVRVWDVPPRVAWWFGTLAGLLALPAAWLARRRTRRLRAVPHPP